MPKIVKSLPLFAILLIAALAGGLATVAHAQVPATQPTVHPLTPAEKHALIAQAEKCEDAGMTFMETHDFVDALPELRKSLAFLKQASEGKDNEDVAFVMSTVGFCLESMGRSTDALPVFQSALEMQKRIYKDQDKPDIAYNLSKVADCLFFAGRYIDALPFYRAALEMRQRIYKNQDNSDVAASLNHFANCLALLGRGAEALPLFKLALQMERNICKNQDNPDIAEAINSVAYCLDMQGRYSEALPMFQASVDMQRRIYKNADDPLVARSLNNLASCLESLGRSADALPLYEAGMKMEQRIHNDRDDPDVAAFMNNVAHCLQVLGRSAESLSMQQATLDMQKRIYQDQDHPAVARSLNNLAACLMSLGRSDDALPIYQAGLDMERRIYQGQDNPDVAQLLNSVASCLQSLNRCTEALPIYRSALEMSQRIYKDQDHPDVATNLNNVAYCLDALNRSAEALPLYRAALKMEQSIYGNQDHPVIANCLSNVGSCLDSLGRNNEALPLFQSAVAMADRLNDPDLFRWSENLGTSLLFAGDAADAAAAFGKSIDSLEKARQSLGGDDQDRMGFMNALAGWDPFSGMVRAQLRLQQPDKAVEYFDQGKARSLLDILERAERQTGGDVLQPAEEAARESRDTVKLQQIARARQDFAAADDADRQLTAAIDQARSLNNADGFAEIQQLQPKLHEAQEHFADVHRQLFNLAGQTVFASPASSLQMQSFLREHQHMLMFSIKDTDAVVLLIPPSGQAITGMYLTRADGKTKLSGSVLKQAITHYRQSVVSQGLRLNRGLKLATTEPAPDTQQDVAAQGYALFSELLPPAIWKQIQDDDLVYVVPDASMSGMPLEMLVLSPPADSRDPTYWIDKGPPTVYGPSAAALLDRSRVREKQLSEQRTYSHEIVLLGDPVLQQDQNQPRLPPPSAGACVTSVKSGSTGEAIGLGQGAVITAYGSFGITGKDQFEAAIDKLAVQKFHNQLSGIPKVKFWLQGQILERELPVDTDPGIEVVDMTLALEQQLTSMQPTMLAAMRDASLTRYGALIPLPGTRVEVEGIYQVFTGSEFTGQPDDRVVVLLGKDATAPRLIESAPGSRYLHLATHGLVESGPQAIYSSVVLTQPEVITPQNTGLLTLQDLFDHWWGKLNGTELVVLSACNSQGLDETRSNAIAGEGVFGLPWGFMYAGSPAVIASTWEVQDHSTAELMEHFYSQLHNAPQASKLKAFVAARQQLKKDYPQPFYWAPFIYLGDPR